MTIAISQPTFSPLVPPLYTIWVKTAKKAWDVSVSSQEYERLLKSETFTGRKVYSNWTALLIPIRTHHVEAFIEDLFLPTTFNVALKIEDIAQKYIAVLACIAIDLVTLPIRLITAIFCYSRQQPSKEQHLFYEFLLEKGFNRDQLKKIDCCIVTIAKISKEYFKEQQFEEFDLAAGIWTTYERTDFDFNFFEMAFITPFPKAEISGKGRLLGPDRYRETYFEVYPDASEIEVEELERIQHEALKEAIPIEKSIVIGFVKLLNEYVPEQIEEFGLSVDGFEKLPRKVLLSKLKKAYMAFSLKNHPDKGGRAEDFSKVSTQWEELKNSAVII